MKYKKQELKKGINLYTINTNKFKTNLLTVFITIPIQRENVTKNALIPMILRRGSKNIPSSEKINIELEEMYGASFDCGIDKIGDNHVLKFYLEFINNEFLPENEDILSDCVNKMLEIIFNPLIINEGFKKEYLENEKEKLREIINGKIDNKAVYAFNRCIEEMYKDKPYGLYKYGYIEDIDGICEKQLYEYYQRLIKECKIDIFLSGDIQENVVSLFEKNENVIKLNDRDPNYIINGSTSMAVAKEGQNENVVEENMDITQGKLVIGLDIDENTKQSKYVALVYNAILGGVPTSKLFQNVREKASLAYTASSSYLRQKNNIFIKCGIEIENYEKAIRIIKEQLEDMRKGNFTNEDMINAKNNIISTIRFIPDEQDTEVIYYFSQELSEFKLDYDEYEKTVQEVTKEQVIELANKIKINTIYFLKGE